MLGFKKLLFLFIINGLTGCSMLYGVSQDVFNEPTHALDPESIQKLGQESAAGFIDHFFFREIGQFFLEIASLNHWQSLLLTLQTAIFSNVFATLLVMMVFLLGVLCYQRLLWLSDRTVKIALREQTISSYDSTRLFLSTVSASLLCWSPILVVGCYLRMNRAVIDTAEFRGSADFQQSLGAGLIAVYMTTVAFRLLQEFFTIGGVSEAIYGFKHSTARYILNRVELTVLLITPMLFLIAFTNGFAHGRWFESVGRFSFITVVGLLFSQFHQLLWPGSRLYDRLLTAEVTANSVWLRYRVAWYVLGCAVFLLATGLTISGWFSVAKALSINIALTMLAGVISFSLRTIVGQKAAEMIRQTHLIEDLGRSADAGPTVRSPRVQDFVRRYSSAANRAVGFLAVISFLSTSYFIWRNWITLPPELLQIEIGGVALAGLVAIAKLLGIGLVTWYLARELPAFVIWCVGLQTRSVLSNPKLVSTLTSAAIIYVGVWTAMRSMALELPVIPWLGTLLTISSLYAAKDFIGDGFSGLVLLFDPRIRPGDCIEIEGRFGLVESVNLFTTIVEDNLGTRNLLPNSIVIHSPIIKSRNQITVPMLIDVRLPKHADAYQAQALMVLVARREPEVVSEPPPHVRFVAFQHNDLRFEIRLLILATADFKATQARLENKLAIEFERHEIILATEKPHAVRFPEELAG